MRDEKSNSTSTTFADEIREKRVGLALASGFFGFYHHAGVLTALHQRGIRPTRVSGASAGALVASMYASGSSPAQIAEDLLAVKRSDFWDAHWPWSRTGFGLLAGHKFASVLSRTLPVHRFEDCDIPLSVNAYDIEEGRTRHLDSGALIPAVRASCAVPYLFSPVEIDGRRYWDGGFAEKTPMVPFFLDSDVDVVIVSYMPPREDRPENKKSGILSFLPSPSSFLADTPPDERRERDQASVRLLRDAGKRVMVLAPERVWLGPFSLDRAGAAMDQGREGALEILDSNDETALGAPTLS
jgi:predicted acylesterase/phospholipase RssA